MTNQAETEETAHAAEIQEHIADLTHSEKRRRVCENGARRHIRHCSHSLKIIENQEIPGITGGAIDSKEGEPGPIMIQGDHGKVQFRNVLITPAK